MIDPKELRIGNLVKCSKDALFNHSNKRAICQLSSIAYPSFCDVRLVDLKGIYIMDKHDRLEHIPLTEEWMVKFGFELEKECLFNFKGFRVWVTDDESGDIGFYHINSETLRYFGSVHQLQNYYFALTGKELEINKKELLK